VLILTPNDFSLSPASPALALDWVRSSSGQQADEHGSCAVSLLPADEDVVLVMPPRALSWHRVALPKVSVNRLRAALDGLLEDQLLDDTGTLHFALEPGKRPGQSMWIAVCRKDWLQSWLQVLEEAGRPASRIVPSAWPLRPGEQPSAVHWAFSQAGHGWLVSADAHGVVTLPLQSEGTLAASNTTDGSQWLSEPSVAGQAEESLDRRLALMPLPSWLLRGAQGDWNLAQFDLRLTGRARQGQRLRQSLRQLSSAPAWRPARWGLAALLLSLVGGLNALAWMERSSLADKRRATTQLLQSSFANITVVLDAPAQMRRELVRLQQSNGSLSDDDLEAMLGALAPLSDGKAPGNIDFMAGEVRLGAWPVPAEQLQALALTLNERGWRASLDGEALLIRPKAP
jgi:general secretion pathway protein L